MAEFLKSIKWMGLTDRKVAAKTELCYLRDEFVRSTNEDEKNMLESEIDDIEEFLANC